MRTQTDTVSALPGGRKPRLPRIELPEARGKQREVIDELLIARGKPGGRLANLYAMMVHQPEVARRMGAMGAYCRFHASPSELVRETAILTACYALDFQYEVRAHEDIIRDRGMPETQIRALADCDWSALPPQYALVARFVRAAVAGPVPDDIAAGIVREFGQGGLIDLTAMAAHYSALAVYDRVLQPQPDPPGHSLSKPSGRPS